MPEPEDYCKHYARVLILDDISDLKGFTAPQPDTFNWSGE